MDHLIISDLPSLSLERVRDLPECSGIYFVCSGDTILYVGKSTNIRDRWKSHHRFDQVIGMYAGASIAWKEVEASDLHEVERIYIERCKPILNDTTVVLGPPKNGKPRRDNTVGLRLTDEDRAVLDEVMRYHDREQADMLRWLVYEEYKRIRGKRD